MVRGIIVGATMVGAMTVFAGVVFLVFLFFLFLITTSDQIGSNGTPNSTKPSMANLMSQQPTASGSQHRLTKPAFALWTIWPWSARRTVSLSRRSAITLLLRRIRRMATLIIIASLSWGVLLMLLFYLAVRSRLGWCAIAW